MLSSNRNAIHTILAHILVTVPTYLYKLQAANKIMHAMRKSYKINFGSRSRRLTYLTLATLAWNVFKKTKSTRKNLGRVSDKKRLRRDLWSVSI